MKNKILIVLVLLLCVLVIPKNAYAADYPTCSYVAKDVELFPSYKKNTKLDLSFPSQNRYIGKCTDDMIRDSLYDYTLGVINPGCSFHDTAANPYYSQSNPYGYVVYDDGKFYCPSEVYIYLDHKHTSAGALWGDKYYFFSFENNTNYNHVIFRLRYASNGAKKYDPTIDGETGDYHVCDPGGAAVSKDFIDMINQITIPNNLDAKTAEELINKIHDEFMKISSKNYCYQDDLQKMEELINDFKTDLKEAIKKSTNISDSERSDILDFMQDQFYQINDFFQSNLLIRSYDTTFDCKGLLDKDLVDVLNIILKIVRILVPIVLIIMVALDFSSVVISNDKDALPKAISKAIKRAIAALVVFFIPTLVINLINMPGISEWQSPDASCIEFVE